MVALTTTQRDVLHVLLTSEAAIGLTDLGQQVGLTARQVQYSLRAVETWLDQRGAQLLKTPGVGVRVAAPTERKQALVQALTSERSFQLVLTAGQRQQALALQLLTTHEPSILYQLQQTVDVSRTTLLKDLDLVEQWLESFDVRTIAVRKAGPREFGLRFYDNATAQSRGATLFRTFPASRSSLAIKHEWNQMTEFIQFQIRPGSILLEGKVASQGRSLAGGDVQLVLPTWRRDLIALDQ